jgi:hypothetical protein
MPSFPLQEFFLRKMYKSKTHTHFPNSRIEKNEKKLMPSSRLENKQKVTKNFQIIKE